MGFKPSSADSSIFVNQRGMIIAIYVDDVLIFGKKGGDINRYKKGMMSFHQMTDSGLVSKILSLRVDWNPDGSISIDQEAYVERIFKELSMQNSKGNSTPMNTSTVLDDKTSPLLDEQNHNIFRRIIGRTMFLAKGTRPDITFTTDHLSQYLAKPRQVHLGAAKHLLRYLRDMARCGLCYKKDQMSRGQQLHGYSDAAFGNSVNQWSTGGYMFMINESPVCWASNKQSIAAESSTEAEYMALSNASRQAVWIRHLLFSLNKSNIYSDRKGIRPIVIHEDNNGAIAIGNNPVYHGKSKHIKIKFHAIRDGIDEGEISAVHMPGEEMVANGLTKA